MRRAVPALAPVLLALAACGGEGPPRTREPEAPPPALAEGGAVPERSYERRVVFLSGEGSDLMAVPFLFDAATRPDGVVREIRAYLGRGDAWDLFFEARWVGPPTRAPWRILPRGPFRIVVGEEDALLRILYREASRELEVEVGPLLADWTGPRGEAYRLREGSLLFAGGRSRGRILDLSRVRGPGDPVPGEWLLLTSGDSLDLLLADPGGGPPGDSPYRGWLRIGAHEARWDEVAVSWDELRPFEEARRSVPTRWSFRAPEGVEGEVAAVASRLTAGEGSGALLPVEGLVLVRGTLRTPSGEAELRGLVRHLQP